MNLITRLCIPALAGLLLFTAAAPPGAEAAAREKMKLEAATEVISEIRAIPEKGIPPALLESSYGLAVIPGVIKVGFVFGGRHGRGVLVVKKEDGSWSDPSFISITGGSVGWQIGAQSTDVILVFKSKKGVDGVTRGKVTLGADLAVAAGPVGRQAEAATDVMLKAEIYSYSRSRGLFAGLSFEGAALLIDHESNEDFYGRDGITPNDIFSNGVGEHASVERFKAAITE